MIVLTSNLVDTVSTFEVGFRFFISQYGSHSSMSITHSLSTYAFHLYVSAREQQSFDSGANYVKSILNYYTLDLEGKAITNRDTRGIIEILHQLFMSKKNAQAAGFSWLPSSFWSSAIRTSLSWVPIERNCCKSCPSTSPSTSIFITVSASPSFNFENTRNQVD